MLFSIETLMGLFPNYEGDTEITMIDTIMLDSREKKSNSLFVPIIGDRFDAHHYIEQAIENGVVATLWDRTIPIPERLKNNCQFFLVENTITSLQQLAQYYRNEVNPIVIGVTGSNGKTSTKDLIASVTSTMYNTYKTQGNLNNHIDLPLTILQIPRNTEVLILEMGMSDFGEIDRLTQIASPNYAVITNIGESHIEFLGSRAGIVRAKCEIINGLTENGILVLDGDEPLLKDVEKNDIEIIRCSVTRADYSNYVISNIEVSLDLTRFAVNGISYTIPLIGTHHAKNATYAIIIANKLQINCTQIQHGFNNLNQSEMRFENIQLENGAVIINDAYNASPTSMIAAIEVIKKIEKVKTKVLVLGDIFQ